MKRTGPTNIALKNLIINLSKLSKKENVKLWSRVSDDLSFSTRSRRSVNLYKIEKSLRDGETAIIPGKVLSIGELNKKVTVAAYQFSKEAKEKINKVGRAISISDLMKENPKAKKVRIMG